MSESELTIDGVLNEWRKTAATEWVQGPEGASRKIGQISKALAKAQGQINSAKKDASNPFFNSSYATLASVIDACKKQLSENGLAVFQKVEGVKGDLSIVTILAHAESGEWVKSTLPLIINKNDMQGLGSAISYGRRYALSAMIGIAQEDDDGNGAGQAHKPPMQNKKQSGKSQNQGGKPQGTKAPQAPPNLHQQISMGMKKNGWNLDQVNAYVSGAYGIKPGQKMSEEMQKEFIVILNKHDPDSAFQELENAESAIDSAVEVKGTRVIKNYAPGS